jgi:hypothetical protein
MRARAKLGPVPCGGRVKRNLDLHGSAVRVHSEFTRTICGCSKRASVRASARKRSSPQAKRSACDSVCGRAEASERRRAISVDKYSLIATRRSRFVSLAR